MVAQVKMYKKELNWTPSAGSVLYRFCGKVFQYLTLQDSSLYWLPFTEYLRGFQHILCRKKWQHGEEYLNPDILLLAGWSRESLFQRYEFSNDNRRLVAYGYVVIYRLEMNKNEFFNQFCLGLKLTVYIWKHYSRLTF